MSKAIQEMKDHQFFLETVDGEDLVVNPDNVESVLYNPNRDEYVVYMVSWRSYRVKNARRLTALVNELAKR